MQNYSQVLQKIIYTAYDAIQEMSVAGLAYKPKPEKWSKKELLGHLVDSAYNNHQRFLSATSQDNLIFQGYAQDEWVQKNDYQNRELAEILDLWKSANLHLSRLIAKLPDELLQNQTVQHNFHLIGMKRPAEGTPSSLSYLIWDYIFHLEHHLGQILEEYEKMLGEFEV